MVYKKSFLSDVVFKINFPALLTLLDESPKKFQEAVIEDFPILEPLQQLEFKIENKLMDVASKKASRTIWKFKNKDNSESIELEYESLAIICKKYTDYSSFKTRVSKVLKIFFNLYPQIVIKRLGVRYINQIKLQEREFFNWKKYLNNNLIMNLDFITKKEQIKRAINTFEISCDEDTTLIFRYGIFNETYPGRVTKKEFVLDYDCYTAVELESEQAVKKMDDFHKIIKTYFDKSIKSAFEAILNHE